MRKVIAALFFSSACLLSAQAGAVTITDLPAGQLFPTPGSNPAGTTVGFTNFNSLPVNSVANFSTSFATFASGGSGAYIEQGSQANNFSAPFFGNPGQDTTPYLSVFGGSNETITLNKGLVAVQFGLYIGSLDAYNSITFENNGSVITTLTGAQIAADTLPNNPTKSTTQPNQTTFASNAFFLFSDLGPFNQVILSSSANSLEVDNVGFAIANAVPETSTWVMLTLGLLSIGFVGYRRKGGLALRVV